MGAFADAALFRFVLSSALRASNAGPMGISILLLVPVRLGDWDIGSAGHRVPKAKDVNHSKAGAGRNEMRQGAKNSWRLGFV
jgi:hypothetical protein